MAIYHLSAQVISRSAGRSSVAAAAYRAGERIIDQRTGLAHDYTRRREEIETHIYAPEGAPEWVQDRSRLWNGVEAGERRRDSQVCREINVALPRELSVDQQRVLVAEYVKEQFVSRGMVADVAIHRGNLENPHAHIMLTMRTIGAEGFGPKERAWNRPEALQEWRERWAETSNRVLERAGRNDRIDHRSLEAQGVHDRLPQEHVGPHAQALHRRGIESDRADMNREIQSHNAVVIDLNKARAEREALRGEQGRLNSGWWNPEEARAVTEAEQLVGTTLDRDACGERLTALRTREASIQNEIRQINERGQRLDYAEKALSARETTLRELAKLERPLEKVQRLFSKDARERYYGVREDLERKTDLVGRFGVKDRPDLNHQRDAWAMENRRIPGLEGGLTAMSPTINVLGTAFDAFGQVFSRMYEHDLRQRRRADRERERERNMDWER